MTACTRPMQRRSFTFVRLVDRCTFRNQIFTHLQMIGAGRSVKWSALGSSRGVDFDFADFEKCLDLFDISIVGCFV